MDLGQRPGHKHYVDDSHLQVGPCRISPPQASGNLNQSSGPTNPHRKKGSVDGKTNPHRKMGVYTTLYNFLYNTVHRNLVVPFSTLAASTLKYFIFRKFPNFHNFFDLT